MGGALFQSLELFYGTNDFAVADASHGVDPVTGQLHVDLARVRRKWRGRAWRVIFTRLPKPA